MINFFLFLFGTAVGSFLNVLIDRLPKEQKITGRSRCDHCRRALAWYDLVPVLSFFMLRGRCRYCRKKISWQYPLVEILTGGMFILIFNFKFSPLRPLGFEGQAIFNYQFPNVWSLINWDLFDYWLLVIGYLGIISCLIVIFFSDWKYQIIPDSLQVAFFVFSFFLHLVSNFEFVSDFGLRISNFLISGLIVMAPILLLWLVTRGKGMGFGDVKLAFNIGFLLGAKAGFLALYFGFVVGAVVGLVLILLKKKKLKSKIAFGPFLAIGIIVLLFFQQEIYQIINKIYGF